MILREKIRTETWNNAVFNRSYGFKQIKDSLYVHRTFIEYGHFGATFYRQTINIAVNNKTTINFANKLSFAGITMACVFFFGKNIVKDSVSRFSK